MDYRDAIHVFIVNSNAGGKEFSAKLRKDLSERKDIEYYVFNTRLDFNAQDIVKAVTQIFKDRRLRIYACGGSGNFCNVLNGIENFENVELGFWPKGLTNDFLKAFPRKDRKKFENLDALIKGESVKIDYIQSDNGRCVNTFSVGLDSFFTYQIERLRLTGVFGRLVPYVISLGLSMFGSPSYPYEVLIDGEMKKGKYSEVFFGNGGTIGGTLCFEKEPDFRDGKGIFYIINRMNVFEELIALISLSARKPHALDYKSMYGYASKITVKRRDEIAFQMDFDGELMPPQIEWNAEIINKGLSFIIPQGVTINE